MMIRNILSFITTNFCLRNTYLKKHKRFVYMRIARPLIGLLAILLIAPISALAFDVNINDLNGAPVVGVVANATEIGVSKVGSKELVGYYSQTAEKTWAFFEQPTGTKIYDFDEKKRDNSYIYLFCWCGDESGTNIQLDIVNRKVYKQRGQGPQETEWNIINVNKPKIGSRKPPTVKVVPLGATANNVTEIGFSMGSYRQYGPKKWGKFGFPTEPPNYRFYEIKRDNDSVYLVNADPSKPISVQLNLTKREISSQTNLALFAGLEQMEWKNHNAVRIETATSQSIPGINQVASQVLVKDLTKLSYSKSDSLKVDGEFHQTYTKKWYSSGFSGAFDEVKRNNGIVQLSIGTYDFMFDLNKMSVLRKQKTDKEYTWFADIVTTDAQQLIAPVVKPLGVTGYDVANLKVRNPRGVYDAPVYYDEIAKDKWVERDIGTGNADPKTLRTFKATKREESKVLLVSTTNPKDTAVIDLVQREVIYSNGMPASTIEGATKVAWLADSEKPKPETILQCVKNVFGTGIAAEVTWWDYSQVKLDKNNKVIIPEKKKKVWYWKGANSYRVTDKEFENMELPDIERIFSKIEGENPIGYDILWPTESSCVKYLDYPAFAVVKVYASDVAKFAADFAVGKVAELAVGSVIGAASGPACVGSMGLSCGPSLIAGKEAAKLVASSTIKLIVPDVKHTFYTGSPGNVNVWGTAFDPQFEETRPWDKGKKRNEACTSDTQCFNNECGRKTAKDNAPLVCCPSDTKGLYAGYDYCGQMEAGATCWSDAQCGSGLECSNDSVLTIAVKKGTCVKK